MAEITPHKDPLTSQLGKGKRNRAEPSRTTYISNFVSLIPWAISFYQPGPVGISALNRIVYCNESLYALYFPYTPHYLADMCIYSIRPYSACNILSHVYRLITRVFPSTHLALALIRLWVIDEPSPPIAVSNCSWRLPHALFWNKTTMWLFPKW